MSGSMPLDDILACRDEAAYDMEAAAKEFAGLGCVLFAACCTDPCDSRTQSTPGMMDSLAYRNDAASRPVSRRSERARSNPEISWS